MKNKISILTAALFFPICAYSQIGVQTSNPQGTFHVDGAKDNPATGVPNAAQQANDVTVSKTGDVGIGTTSPTRKLDVQGSQFINAAVTSSSTKDALDINIGQNGLTYGNRTDNYGIVMRSNSTAFPGIISRINFGDINTTAAVGRRYLSFSVGQTPNELMYLTDANNGRVGIGTTSPARKLDVQGSQFLNAAITGADTKDVLDINIGQDGFGYGNRTDNYGINMRSSSSDQGGIISRINFGDTHSVTAGGTRYLSFSVGKTPNELMYLTDANNGRVGIGTIAPEEKVDVSGAISVKGQAATNKTGAGTLDYANSVTPQTRVLSWGPNASSDGIISFWTGLGGVNAVEKMRIHSNGNVGIGTTAPTVKLDVAQAIGTSEATQLRIVNTSPAAANNTAYIGFNSYNGAGANWGIGSMQNSADEHNSNFNIMYSAGTKYDKFVTIKPTIPGPAAKPLLGIGTSMPTNTLHVSAAADPLKLEGVQNGTGENLVIDASGVVKKGAASSSYQVLFDLTPIADVTISDSNPNGDDSRPGTVINSQTITLTKDALVQVNFAVPVWDVFKYGTTAAPTDGGSKMLRTHLVVDNTIVVKSSNAYSNSSVGTGTGTSPEALKGVFFNTGSAFIKLSAGTHTIRLDGTCNPYITCRQGGGSQGTKFQAVALY